VTEFGSDAGKPSEQAGAGAANVTLYQSIPRPVGDRPVTEHNNLEPSYQNWLLADIVIADIDSGAIERLAKNVTALGYWISPDGRHLAYNNWKGVDKNRKGMSFRPVVDLCLVSLTNAKSRVLAHNLQGEYTAFSFRCRPTVIRSHIRCFTT